MAATVTVEASTVQAEGRVVVAAAAQAKGRAGKVGVGDGGTELLGVVSVAKVSVVVMRGAAAGLGVIPESVAAVVAAAAAKEAMPAGMPVGPALPCSQAR